ncbi:MAG TPA: hypothetical protein PKD15_00875 [Candidatus Saccharibacteria bacterium]|nr:hypothetical protein [Candidatus Saccharibacteria bacterium]
MSEEQRQENLYVLTYLKAMIPRHMKESKRRLTLEEIRAIIAEARVNWNDDDKLTA